MKATIYYSPHKGGVVILISSLILTLLFSTGLAQGERPLPEFKDLKGDTGKFVSYYYNIQTSVSEQKILEKALSEIPAPCCSDHSAQTC